MTRLRQTIAKRLKEAQNTAAMLTTFNDVDMTAVIDARASTRTVREEARREARLHGLLRQGRVSRRSRTSPRSTPRSKATRSSITTTSTSRSRFRRPRAWSCRWSATPTSWASPTSRRRSRDFGKRAKDGTLTMDDMTGRHLHHLQRRRVRLADVHPDHQPAADRRARPPPHRGPPGRPDGQIVIRPMMYLALSYDHRLIDGREAVTVPRDDQGSDRGSDAAADRPVSRTSRRRSGQRAR